MFLMTKIGILAGVVAECIAAIGMGNPLGIFQCVMVRQFIIHFPVTILRENQKADKPILSQLTLRKRGGVGNLTIHHPTQIHLYRHSATWAGSDGIPVPDPTRSFFQLPDPSRPEI